MSNNRNLENLICDAREGQADDATLTALTEELEDNPKARRQFIERTFLEAMLEQEMELAEAVTPVTPEAATSPQPRRVLPFILVGIASAAAAALLVAAGFLARAPVNPQPQITNTLPAESPVDSHQFVTPTATASVIWTDGVAWEQEAHYGTGDDLRPGAPVGLASGKALLQTTNGTRILVGPETRFQFVGDNGFRLFTGDAGILVEDGSSIVCEVPGGKIRDVGTDFSLRTRGDVTRAQVFHGSIVANLTEADQRLVIKAGQGLEINAAAVSLTPRTFPEAPFLRVADSAGPVIGSEFDYPARIQADGATRHWRFSARNDDKVDNAIPLPTPLQIPSRAKLHKLPNGNAVMRLREANKSPATADLVDELPELQRDFTIELWFSAPTPDSNSAGSVLMGITSTAATRLNHLLLIKVNGAWPTDGLRLGVLYRSRAGEHGLATITPKAVKANQWHYAAIRRRGNRLTTYLNGRPTVSQAVPAGFIGNEKERRLFLGHLTDTQGKSRTHPYKGDVDELAIYPKALSDATILAHYRQGRALFHED